jgi:oxygen-independent coproporphyrinogen-3 oxidase
MMSEVLPKSAYVHIPFCAHRCGYCNFTLVAGRGDLIEPFLQALELELKSLQHAHTVDTLFFGGGTPSQLSAEQLRRLCEVVLQWFPLEDCAEFSIEANPADFDATKAAVLAEFGTTRISLGAQSFDDRKLAVLERDHRASDIHRAFDLARDWVDQVSLDLIFAAPGEEFDEWSDDVQAAIALQPDHVSTYGLTYERGTAFWTRRQKGELSEIPETDELAMYETSIDRLSRAGFEHYEVSNFARPGCRCRHNEVYWTGGQYYAAGPGAARRVGNVRETNHRSTTTYIKRVLAGESPVAERETLSPDDLARERLVFGMRRLEGVELRQIEQLSGMSVEELVGAALCRHVDAGLLEVDSDKLRLTHKGLLVSDSIWPDFL